MVPLVLVWTPCCFYGGAFLQLCCKDIDKKSKQNIWFVFTNVLLSIYQSRKKTKIMKKYIVITASDFSYEINAANVSDAAKIGRTLCRRTGEKFINVYRVYKIK
jgi:hypothetical protein